MYIKNKNSVSLKYLLFCGAYFPWIISWMFTSSYYKDIIHPYAFIKFWELIGICLLALKLFCNKYLKKKTIMVQIIIIITGWFVSKDNDNASFVFYTLLIVISCFDLDIKWIIKKTMQCQIAFITLIIVSALIGIIQNEQIVSHAGGILRSREGLGFTYTTFAPNYFLSIVIEWYFLEISKKKKTIMMHVVTIVLLNFFLYQKTKTRTSFILVMLIVGIRLIEMFIRNNKIKGKLIIKNSYIILCISSVLISVFYSSSISWMNKLNDLLSQRLRFAQAGITKWGISWFGTSVTWDTKASTYNYIDSSYVNILVCYGVVILFFTIVGLSITLRYACRINDKKLAIALTLWSVKAFIDPQLFLVWFNPFLLYVGVAILSQFKKYDREEKNVINNLRI